MSTSAAMSPSKSRSHPLRNRTFQLFWAGSTVSLFGDQFYLVALPWVVLQLSGSSLTLGLILMAAAVPRAILMLIGGVFSDRMSPRRIMIGTASARAIFVSVIGLLLWRHALQLWHLYLLSVGFGLADAFAIPASRTYLPFLVDPAQLPAANAAAQSAMQISTIVGPAPAGIVIKKFGSAVAFFLDAISFLFIIGALWKLPDPPKRLASGNQPKMWPSVVEGLNYVGNDPALRSLLLLAAVLNFCMSGPVTIGLAYLSKERFGSATAFGIWISSVAAGGLIGSLLAGMRHQQKRGLLLLMVSSVLGICTILIGILNQLWFVAGDLLIMGLGSGFVGVHIQAWFQQRVERALLGRVMSVLMFAAIGLLPVSLLAAGIMVQTNVKGMFLVAGTAVLVATGIAAVQRPVREIA